MREKLKDFVIQHLPEEECLKMITDADTRVMNKDIKLLYNKRDSILASLEGKTIKSTVLNIDIVNSTEQTKRLSDTQQAEYYQRFIESTSDLIQSYGGYVLKNVGDCVIGFFPSSGFIVENHDSAVLCGLTMFDMLKVSLNPYFVQRRIPSIKCRISADFGSTKVIRVKANGGYSEIDLFGTAMNSVSKILHWAKPNQMVIGDSLFWQLVDADRVSFKILKRWDLRGKHSYPVYRVLRK